jgi:hypothetical protein
MHNHADNIQKIQRLFAVLLIVLVAAAFSPVMPSGQVHAASGKVPMKLVYLNVVSAKTTTLKSAKAATWRLSSSKYLKITKKSDKQLKLKVKKSGMTTISAYAKGKPLTAKNLIAKYRVIISKALTYEMTGKGHVIRLLPDDLSGDRHQRFIIELASGQTLLIAHNIDIAPRVDPIAVGHLVQFKGEFIWSEKGGTVHWTHHDPAGKHTAGWLKCGGKIYS